MMLCSRTYVAILREMTASSQAAKSLVLKYLHWAAWRLEGLCSRPGTCPAVGGIKCEL